MSKKRVLFVCLGNICRSPVAHGIFRHLVEQEELSADFYIDSAGTGNWHVGEAPDPRSQESALRNGIDISDLRARQFSAYDFEQFDYIFAMDKSNYNDMLDLANTDAEKAKVQLILSYDPEAAANASVPDPYYGKGDGFEKVFQMLHRSCRALLDELKGR